MSTRDDDAAGDDVRGLVAAYALDAVDDVERRAVERLVQQDPDAARELAELRSTAAALGAASATAPPPSLRGDVLAEVRRTAQLGPQPAVAPRLRRATERVPDPVPVPGAGPRRPRRVTTWLAVAATVVAAAAVPGALAVREIERSHRAEQRALAMSDLLTEPGAQVVRADVEGGGTAVGVLTADRALFTAVDLPDPGEDRDLQLWVVRDGAAMSVGVLEAEDGRARAIAGAFRAGDALAVTVEPAGGSEQPTTEPVVVLSAAA